MDQKVGGDVKMDQSGLLIEKRESRSAHVASPKFILAAEFRTGARALSQ
jgi:hypothetical protein